MTRPLYVAVGVDCDPDRNVYPESYEFNGTSKLIDLMVEFPEVKLTLNVRSDLETLRRNENRHLKDIVYRIAEDSGHQIAWRLHFYGEDGKQTWGSDLIEKAINSADSFVKKSKTVHMGWTYQDCDVLKMLKKDGIEIDYSALPRMCLRRTGVEQWEYDWSWFPIRPLVVEGVKMIPAYTFRNRLLEKRFGGERVMLTPCTHFVFYHRLVDSFFDSGLDFFVMYFHADELISGVKGWRKYLYSYENLKNNLLYIKTQSQGKGYDLRWCTIEELAKILWP